MVSHFHNCIHYNGRAFFAELLERVRSLGRDLKTTRFVVKNVTVFRAVVFMSTIRLHYILSLTKLRSRKLNLPKVDQDEVHNLPKNRL